LHRGGAASAFDVRGGSAAPPEITAVILREVFCCLLFEVGTEGLSGLPSGCSEGGHCLLALGAFLFVSGFSGLFFWWLGGAPSRPHATRPRSASMYACWVRASRSAAGGLIATLAILCVTATAAGASPIPLSEAELANRTAAEEDARHLLEGLRVPPGATFSPTEPVGASPLLGKPPTRELTKQIELTSWWTVPGEPRETLAWIKANPPEGSALTGGGEIVTIEGDRVEYAQFLWPPVPSVLRRRSLLATVGSGPSGTTILRVDVQVVWFVPRPASERIPRSARLLEVVENRHRRDPKLTVIRGRTAREIVAIINGLPISQPDGRLTSDGARIGCPRVRGFKRMRLIFRARPKGRALAVAHQPLPAGYCHPMALSIRGKNQPPLEGSYAVVRALRPRLNALPPLPEPRTP
jgi:hypothetical protein